MIDKILLDEIDMTTNLEGLYSRVAKTVMLEKFLKLLSFVCINTMVYNRPTDVCTFSPDGNNVVVGNCTVFLETPGWGKWINNLTVKGDISEFGSIGVNFDSNGIYIELKRRPFSEVPMLDEVFTSVTPSKEGKTLLYLHIKDMSDGKEVVEFLESYVKYIFSIAPFNNRPLIDYSITTVDGDDEESQFTVEKVEPPKTLSKIVDIISHF